VGVTSLVIGDLWVETDVTSLMSRNLWEEMDVHQ